VGHPESLSVNAVLRRLAPFIEASAGNQIQVALRPSPGAGRVKADAAQLEAAILSLIAHACNVLTANGGGQLLIDTARVELPHAGHPISYVLLSLNYNAAEPDVERLFDPDSPERSSLARAQVHWLAAEYGGYVSARSHSGDGSRIELLLPRVADQAALPAPAGGVETILLVEPCEAVRRELHNFFESAGYNLIEAADAEEAVSLGEMLEASLHLVIAESPRAGEVLRHLSGLHPSLRALCIVDQPVLGADQIRRPFTERELLHKAAVLLCKEPQASPASV
jgi:hypothetical protein